MNRYYSILFILFFCIYSISFAQEIRIKIFNAEEKAVLFELEGEKTSKIDSVISINGNFQFSLKKKHNGFYRLQLDNKSWIDFIYDREEVFLETDANNILDSLKVIKSVSNKIYYAFIELNKDYKTKTELLQLILARYPKEDDYYQTTQQDSG